MAGYQPRGRVKGPFPQRPRPPRGGGGVVVNSGMKRARVISPDAEVVLRKEVARIGREYEQRPPMSVAGPRLPVPPQSPRWRDREPGLYVLAVITAVLFGVAVAILCWPLTVLTLVGYAIAVFIGRRHYRRVRSAAHWAEMGRRADEQNARWLKNGDLW